MKVRLPNLIRPFKRNNKKATLQQIYQGLGVKNSVCIRWIEPIKAIAIGEEINRRQNRKRPAIIIVEPEFQTRCIIYFFLVI